MEREFIAERQKGLQAYLDVITSHHILSNCELVKKFLDPNSYSVNYTGKWGTVKPHYSFTAACVRVFQPCWWGFTLKHVAAEGGGSNHHNHRISSQAQYSSVCPGLWMSCAVTAKSRCLN